MSIYTHIGHKIRDYRIHYKGKGLTQEALADKLAVSANTVCRWESATYKPSIEHLLKVAAVLGAPIGSFLPGHEPATRLQMLLTAAADLDDEDIDEVVEYAKFRKARRNPVTLNLKHD